MIKRSFSLLAISCLITLTACSGAKEPPPIPTGVGGPGTSFEPLDPNAGFDPNGLDPNAGIDPNTGLPFDPNAGIDPNTGLPFDPNAGAAPLPFPIDPSTGQSIDPNTGLAVDPATGLPLDTGVDAGIAPGEPAPTDSTFNPTDTGITPDGEPLPDGIVSGPPGDSGSVTPDDPFGGIPDLAATGPGDTTEQFGNKQLGFVATPVMQSVSGLAVSGGQVYFTHYKKGSLISFNKRQVRSFSLSNGENKDITIFDHFRDADPPTPLLSGVAVLNGEVWSSLDTPDSEGYNLYRHDTAGEIMGRYKVGGSDVTISDLAAGGGYVYLISSTTQSVIQFNINSPENSKILFSGDISLDPVGVSADSSGNAYVSDRSTNKVIKFSSSGSRALEFDGKGVGGKGEAFSGLGDLAIDSRNGDIYVASGAGPATAIYRFKSDGSYVHRFSSSDITSPGKIAVGANGHVYVMEMIQGTAIAFDAGK